jgi:chitin-binding protein
VAASCVGADTRPSGQPKQVGDTVVHGEPRRKFECRPWPNTPWCWLPDYEPGKNLFYDDAWTDQGACP